jgi:hypothetical protein
MYYKILQYIIPFIQAIAQAARATLVLTGSIIIHTGNLWFSARRPAQIIEREGVTSTPTISYSTQSITGQKQKT